MSTAPRTDAAVVPDASRLLWDRVKRRRIGGLRFRRVLDGAGLPIGVRCPKAKLRVLLSPDNPSPQVAQRPSLVSRVAVDGYRELSVWTQEAIAFLDRLEQRIREIVAPDGSASTITSPAPPSGAPTVPASGPRLRNDYPDAISEASVFPARNPFGLIPVAPDYESPLEKTLAAALDACRRPAVTIIPQFEVATRWWKRYVDIVLKCGQRQVAVEVDGRHHLPRWNYDRKRDAVILAEEKVDIIYRLPGWVVHHHLPVALILLATLEPELLDASRMVECVEPDEVLRAVRAQIKPSEFKITTEKMAKALTPILGATPFGENADGTFAVVHGDRTMPRLIEHVREVSSLGLREWLEDVDAFGSMPRMTMAPDEEEELGWVFPTFSEP